MTRRRCHNKAPHEPHQWHGLNTRGPGYQCAGVNGKGGSALNKIAVQARELVANLRGEVPTDAPDVEPEDAALMIEQLVAEIEKLREATQLAYSRKNVVYLERVLA